MVRGGGRVRTAGGPQGTEEGGLGGRVGRRCVAPEGGGERGRWVGTREILGHLLGSSGIAMNSGLERKNLFSIREEICDKPTDTS